MISPSDYIKANVLANEVGKEMIMRLDWMTLKPHIILDVGCGPSDLTLALQSRYVKAFVLALDHSEAMLQYAQKRHPSLSSYLCADAAQLPLKDQSVDLIFANFFLAWQKDIISVLGEWRRILRPEGLLMFNVFGPDTLLTTFSSEVLPERMDMHIIGDLLLKEGFSDPVLDVDYYTLTYSSKEKLLTEAYASGMLKSNIPSFQEDLAPNKEGRWSAKYEIIYAHAFKTTHQESQQSENGMIRIPLEELRQQLKSK